MAKAKSKPASDVVVHQQKAGAVTNWRDRVKTSVQDRKAVNDKLPGGGGNFMSFRGGAITVGNVPQPNPSTVIVLASAFDRAYYEGDYQPGSPASPDCYSFDGVKPHEKSADPQSTTCANCPKNQFKSARNGNGKACKEGVKFAMLHADALKGDIAESPLVMGRLSVLNTRTWRDYANGFGDDEALWMYLTKITNQTDPKTQYRVSFERSLLPNDDNLMNALASREIEAKNALLTPYPDFESEPAPQRKSGRAKKF